MSVETTPGLSSSKTHYLFRVNSIHGEFKGDFEDFGEAVEAAKLCEGHVTKFIPPDGVYAKLVWPTVI